MNSGLRNCIFFPGSGHLGEMPGQKPGGKQVQEMGSHIPGGSRVGDAVPAGVAADPPSPSRGAHSPSGEGVGSGRAATGGGRKERDSSVPQSGGPVSEAPGLREPQLPEKQDRGQATRRQRGFQVPGGKWGDPAPPTAGSGLEDRAQPGCLCWACWGGSDRDTAVTQPPGWPRRPQPSTQPRAGCSPVPLPIPAAGAGPGRSRRTCKTYCPARTE